MNIDARLKALARNRARKAARRAAAMEKREDVERAGTEAGGNENTGAGEQVDVPAFHDTTNEPFDTSDYPEWLFLSSPVFL